MGVVCLWLVLGFLLWWFFGCYLFEFWGGYFFVVVGWFFFLIVNIYNSLGARWVRSLWYPFIETGLRKTGIPFSVTKCLKEHKWSSAVNVTKYFIFVCIILITPLFCTLTCFALLFPLTHPILVLIVFVISVGIWFLGGSFVSGEGRKKIRPQNRIG